jgi:alcohol dehydrogenase (quinone), cytochrome c subunit
MTSDPATRRVSRRYWLLPLCALLTAGLLLLVACFVSDSTVGNRNLAISQPVTPTLITRGAYVARIADCAGCHSVEGRPPYSGGLAMNIPIGTLISSNITPDPISGIGRWSFGDFDRAVRYGVARHHSLYPAMPFTSYARFRREDVEALYAYFRFGVQPQPIPVKPNRIPFPLSLRFPLTAWRWAFAPAPRPFAITAADPVLERGAYLVEVGGHCGECHTARGAALQMTASQASDGASFLAGGMADGWFAPSLRNGAAGVGSWSEQQIADFLLTGRNDSGIAFGGMSDAVVHGTSHLTRDDALAMARFLKSLPAENSIAWQPDGSTAHALHTGDVSARGALSFINNCAACHRPDGRGYEGVFPALAGNPVVASSDPTSLVRIVIEGASSPVTRTTPAQFTMPALGARMTDQEVADVTTFIRRAWGNRAAPVDEAFVRRVRASTRIAGPVGR